MAKFKESLQQSNLHDLGYLGQPCTWRRGSFSGGSIQECLDRGVTSVNWNQAFPRAVIWHLPYAVSDHKPLLLDLQLNL